MREAFEALGLPHDADERAIKRAYAAKVKLTRPDVDPEGFQRLHDAYRQALRWLDIRNDPNWRDHDWDDEDETEDSERSGDDTDARASIDATAALDIDADPRQSDDSDTPRESDRSEHGDALDLDPLFDEALRTAFDKDPQRIRRWLHEQPMLWSLQHKATIGFWFLRLLDDRRPPIPGHNFDTIVEFFGYHDLHSGYDPLMLRQLRAQLDRYWEDERKRFATPGISMVVQPTAPVPWSTEACLTRIRMEQARLASDHGVSREDHERAIQRIGAQEHRQLIDPPHRGRDLWLMSIPGYARSAHNFLMQASGGIPERLSEPFRREQIRFWLAAGDDRRWSWPRTQVALTRCMTWTLALALIAFGGAVISGVRSTDDVGFGTTTALQTSAVAFVVYLVVVGCFLGIWLASASIKSVLLWQSGAESNRIAFRWLHRLFVPSLVSVSMAYSARSTISIEAFYLALTATIVAIVRLYGSHPQNVRDGPNLPPRLMEPYSLLGIGTLIAFLPLLIEADGIAIGLLLGFWGTTLAFWSRSLWLRRVR